MAELATIARPYAEAVFRVAQPAKLNAWAEVLSEMAQVASVPAFREIAGNPRFDRAQLTDIFLASLKVSMDAEAKKPPQYADRKWATFIAARNRAAIS